MAPLISLQALSLLTLSIYTQLSAAEPGVVGFTFEKRQAPARLQKRASSAQATLFNSEGGLLYVINTTVGTPPQNIALQLDTGSSDFWVPWIQVDACAAGNCTYGSYDPSKSSTSVEVGKDEFNITYGDNSGVNGDFLNETVTIAGATLQNMRIGVATTETRPAGQLSEPYTGIVGVSFDSGETAFVHGTGPQYPNVVSQLVLQGDINTAAYSLWLNDLDATQGNILFGGVDTAKYNGDLVVLPLQPAFDSGIINRFTVTFAGLEITGAGGTTVYNVASSLSVILDSGSTDASLPMNILEAVYVGLGGVNSDQYGPVVPCSVGNSQGVFKFRFGNSNGPVINVNIAQFLSPITDTYCSLGIDPADENGLVFGDTFLRSAYVVYNLAGNQVAIAETNFNTSSSNVVAITAADTIPGATSTAVDTEVSGGALSTVFVQSGTWNLGTATNTAASSTSSSAKKGSASGVVPPSSSVMGTVFMGIFVLISMLSGSVIIFL